MDVDNNVEIGDASNSIEDEIEAPIQEGGDDADHMADEHMSNVQADHVASRLIQGSLLLEASLNRSAP